MKIVVIGGYGAVGSSICENLSEIYPNQVVAAGRDINKAKKLAEKLQNKVIPYAIDINKIEDGIFWEDVKLVIMCLDLKDTKFVEFCVDKEINYIDISANYLILKQIESLPKQPLASSVVLSVGLAPGITNLLAKHGLNRIHNPKEIDIFVLLGLGEKHGDHAFEWTFDNFHTQYAVQNQSVKSFTNPKTTNLEGNRDFYLFDFADQHVLSNSAEKVRTRLAFDLNFMTNALGLFRKLGVTRIFKNKKVQSFLIPLFKNLGMGSEIYGVKVAVTAQDGTTTESSVSGYGEGKVTALVASLTAQYLLENPTNAGVFHLHNVITNIPDFLKKLNIKMDLA